MSTADLAEITDIKRLRELRDLYLKDWPNNCVGYYCLDNFYKWRLINDGKCIEHLKIYSERDRGNKEITGSGLYVILDRYQLFMGSIDKSDCKALTNALDQLDWRMGFKVSSFLECHRPAVLNTVKRNELQCEYDRLILMYFMPRAEAKQLQINCPTGFYVRQLCSANDAETIDSLWPNRHPGSLFLMRRLIDWNANAGVCVEGTNELVAWCLRLQGGFLGVLQVKDEYKRLGLGSVVTCALSRYIAEQGDDIMALVFPENTPSRGMFEKLGFAVTEQCYWLRTFPTVEHYVWPEGK